MGRQGATAIRRPAHGGTAASSAVTRVPPHAYFVVSAVFHYLGPALAVMNSVFYLALDRLPLGTVAAIEFLPVVVLAAVAARTRRNVLALVAAVAGVYLLTD